MYLCCFWFGCLVLVICFLCCAWIVGCLDLFSDLFGWRWIVMFVSLFSCVYGWGDCLCVFSVIWVGCDSCCCVWFFAGLFWFLWLLLGVFVGFCCLSYDVWMFSTLLFVWICLLFWFWFTDAVIAMDFVCFICFVFGYCFDYLFIVIVVFISVC